MNNAINRLAHCLIVATALSIALVPSTSVYGATWDIITLVSDGDVGTYCDFQVDGSGNLHVVYRRADLGTLEYLPRIGGVWQSAQMIDPSGSVDGHCGLAVEADGTARVSYRRGDTGALWYGGPEDMLTWSTETIASIGEVGLHCDLRADTTGDMRVAYLRNDTGTLETIWSLANIWQVPVTLDSSGSVAGYCGLALENDGTPRISYRRNDTGALWYGGPEEVLSWDTETIVSVGEVGLHCDLQADTSGNLRVAYLRADKGNLETVSSNGSIWQEPVTLDSSGVVAGYCGVALDTDGTPRVSYRRSDTGALWCAGPEQSSLWATQTLYQCEHAGRYVSLAQGPDGRFGCVFYRYDDMVEGSVCFIVLENDQKGSVRPIVNGIGNSASATGHVDLQIGSDNLWNIVYRNDFEKAVYYATADTVPIGIHDGGDPVSGPKVYELTVSQNYPNPFNPVTTINYGLDTRRWVTLEIYDVRGQLVKRLVEGFQEAGAYSVSWDGYNNSDESVSSGIYFYRLVAGKRTLTKKMVLLK